MLKIYLYVQINNEGGMKNSRDCSQMTSNIAQKDFIIFESNYQDGLKHVINNAQSGQKLKIQIDIIYNQP